jgi:class 3 adenylate cyclase
MIFGRFRLVAPLEPSSIGPAFRADADGEEYELRQPRPSLARRLRILARLKHSLTLPLVHLDLAHDPPYLVLPTSQPATLPIPVEQVVGLAASFASLLAGAHRLGLSLGQPALRRARSAYQVDLTSPGTNDADDPAGDVPRLAAIFNTWGAPADFPRWSEILRKMTDADCPTASEVAQWFDPSNLEATQASLMVDKTMTMPMAPQPGESIGRFKLLQKLGEGGMGIVYKAEDISDGTIAAIKLLRHGPAMDDHPARRRFVREGRILAALDSPNVTRLIEAGVDDERCFLALEFVDGPTLGARIRNEGKVDEKTALSLIADAARGLAAAHSAGIVHRDVKPDNMLLATVADGGIPQLKMTDFGLARSVMPTESLEITRAGTAVGTPLYMAPEQFGSDPVDARADVYGLAATLFYILTGRTPFQADGLAALAREISSKEAPSVENMARGVSAATVTLVARCLSKDPARRPIDAGALLRELDKLRGGEPLELGAHPRVPVGTPHVREYVYTWDLGAAPEKIWPFVSNTERLNRAAGLPSVNYSLMPDPQRGVRRFAAAKVSGLRMEWEEHPYEWVEGRRMGVLREFSRGPFVWFLSIVELEPLPNGGTRVRQTLRAEPRGLLGRLAMRIELGLKAGRSLGRVYRRMDEVAAGRADTASDPFEPLTTLPKSRDLRVRAGVNRLIAAGATAEAADILALFLSNAPEPEVARIRPLALGRRFGVEDAEMTDACLRAVPAGLLQLQWDVICPLCRIPSGRKDTLRELKEHENCQACVSDFRTDFAASVELVFKAHPDIRTAVAGAYCAGGPAHSPHVVAQARVVPKERLELSLALSEGGYRVRGPQLPWSLDLKIDRSASSRRCEVDLAGGVPVRGVVLAPGGQILVIRNELPHEMVVRVERTAARDDVLTAASAIALPAFRDLFPDELLSPGQLAPASTVTLLWVKIADGEALVDRLGEARAFQQIQAAFRVIESRVRAEGGVVVKAVGEGLISVFGEVTAAVRASLGLHADLIADQFANNLQLQAGLHRGLALVASVNDRLDYFGHAVRLTTRLGDLAEPGELVISAAVGGDSEVAALLRGRTIRLDEVAGSDRTKMLAYRLPLAAN